MQRGQRGTNVGLILLLSQIYQAGLGNIPPITLGTLGLNIFLFLSPFKGLMNVCISVNEGYYRQDWQRLILSPFHHADDLHLYFNMVSMLWKGIKLEPELGSAQFACIIAVFSQLIGILYMLLEFALAEITGDPFYNMQCAVGFSGVLFALKVLNNHYHPGGTTYVMGMPVSNRYTCWVELVLIHLLSPGTSFVGHLSGILVGLLYTQGPLKKIMQTVGGLLLYDGNYGGRTYYNNAGYSGHRNNWHQQSTARDFTAYTGGLSEEEQVERAIRNSYHERGYSGHRNNWHQQSTARDFTAYTGGLSEEEQVERAIRNSYHERGGPRNERQPYEFYLSDEEIRRRRLDRFHSQ